MQRPVFEPKVNRSVRQDTEGDHELQHPAFGQIVVQNLSGGAEALYGSDFEHHSTVRIEVSESSVRRSLSRDWPHPGRTILQLEMTNAQWAHFISTPNMGSGTQCTLRYRQEGPLVQVPGFPLRDTGEPEARREVAAATEAAVEAMAKLRSTVTDMPGLTKRQRDTLLDGVFQADRKLKDSLPFILSSFGKHLESRAEKAKMDITAWAQHFLTRAMGKAPGELPISDPKTIDLEGSEDA